MRWNASASFLNTMNTYSQPLIRAFISVLLVIIFLVGVGRADAVYQGLEEIEAKRLLDAEGSQTFANKQEKPVGKATGNESGKAAPQKNGISEKKEDGTPGKATPTVSLKEKEQWVETTLANVLASAFRIEPVEYSIWVQVEAASLLWETDRERAHEELKSAWARLRELMGEKNSSSRPAFGNKMSEAERARLKQAILRKIAKLNPELVKEWTGDAATGEGKTKPAAISDVEGGTAIIAIAVEQIQREPEKAMTLAEMGLSSGAVYAAATFLTQLWYRDKQLAEQLALVYLDKLPVGPTSNLFLVTRLYSFLSPQMSERYFQALATRLRLAMRPDLSLGDCRDLLTAANKGVTQSLSYPAWQEEFVRLASEAEKLLASRPPVTVPSKMISMSGGSAASPGDTAEIEHSSQKLDAVRDQKLKDAEYRRLAIEAAEKADLQLAERLLGRISDESLRRQTSIGVYGPLVKKSLQEKDWAQARSLALKVADPMGLSLIVDHAAKAMLSAKQDKQLVRNFYADALANLDRETPSLYVAKGVITIAKARLGDEPEDSFSAANLAVSVLNKSDIADPYTGKTGLAKGLASWIEQPNLILREDDYFDVTETLGPLFKDLSRRDLSRSQDLAAAFLHPGLKSLAQLGIAKGIQEDLKKTKSLTGKPAPTPKEK